MIIIKKTEDLRLYLEQIRNNHRSVGFVPTLGALHKGHISLIKTAKDTNAVVVCSIFVNRAQFNDPADYARYPVTLEEDIYKLETNGCDILFLPSEGEIYPDGIHGQSKYDLGNLENILEGKFRPGHFQGVCMVMDRLLQIVGPDDLYLGQKDFQQCLVITRLVMQKGWGKDIHIHICPIVREEDGLAMSSRNRLLDDDERIEASGIFDILQYIRSNIGKRPLAELKQKAVEDLVAKQFLVDYVEIANADNLQPWKDGDSLKKVVVLVAAYLGKVRLIDNLLIAQD
jgi:pantoate--beta-alanine ligase